MSVEERVIEIVQRADGGSRGPGDPGNLISSNDLGADSLDTVELVMEFRKKSSTSPSPMKRRRRSKPSVRAIRTSRNIRQ